MVKVKHTGEFYSDLRSVLEEDENYQELVDLAVERFVKNPKDTRLEVHPLKRRMKDKWAFSVDDDVRIVFEWLRKRTVRFLAIGGHPRVYRRGMIRV